VFTDFKNFIMRGNVLDLAVAVIIGGAFGKIVTSLVNDVLMPPIGALLGGVSFKNFFITLSGVRYATLEEAQQAGAATINYGQFANVVIEFLIIAFAVFLIVQQVKRLKGPAEVAPPATKECEFCFSAIPVKARRCPQCTSALG
jgi:large conductance mechanosensitive channel